jgi:CubicO group peptidase (beta-lactamase class C family)
MAVPDDRIAAAERFLTDWLSDERIPGAALAVVDGDDVVHAAGYGARDLDTNAPATADTLYGVASVTKSFTALAVLQRVAAGDVALEDPVSEHVDLYDGLADPPTVHELLCHGSGMPSDGASVVLIARLMGADPVEVPLSSDDDLRRHVDGALQDRTDGDRFFYYNTGYTALGKLVAAVDGRPFPEYVDEEVLEPLGMDRATVAPEALSAFEDAMTPYREDDGERVAAGFPVKGVGAAGGLVASARDLAAYLRYQHDPDPGVVDPDLLERARTGHSVRQTYLDGTEQAYGYGWMRRPLLGEEVIEHGGSLGVSTAYVGTLADRDLGVALACNDSPGVHPQFVGPALLAVLTGGEPTDTRFHALREKAGRVAGTYESHRGVQTATVERDGANLAVTLETALGGESLVARPASADPGDLTYHTTAASGADVPLEFVDDGDALLYRRWRLRAAED